MADAACDTGFANVSHNLIDQLYTKYDISVLALNYYGDPHRIQQRAKLYNPTARVQGDLYGIHRVQELLHTIKPDIVLCINDPWVISSYYADHLAKFKGLKVAYIPIDAENINADFVEPLAVFDHIIGYTQFGIDQMKLSGLPDTVQTHVIPHGVDTKLYRPLNRAEARKKNGFPLDWFIVNTTGRNQIRKRIDLDLFYFSEWVKKTNKPDTVKIHYHGALQDEGWNIDQLIDAFGIRNRFIITAPNITPAHGLPIDLMPWVYAPADVGLTCTMGGGWELTVHERMAMKIPMIVPRFSALGEWANGGVHYTEISNIPYFNPKGLNTRAGIPTPESTIDALETIYVDTVYRNHLAEAGYALATQKKYSWYEIAKQFDTIFKINVGRT